MNLVETPSSVRALDSAPAPKGASGLYYRADIDGLRALAVVPVVLYHLGFRAFSGGFAGVDVFFVISGYLMANIIYGALAARSFSLAGFYERRIRRIFPALYAMLAVCTMVGFAVLLPSHLRVFGESLAAVASFASNWLFRISLGYFDGRSLDTPLLHTWSLAVEEQFYLLFPLLLMCARDLPRKWVARVILAGAVVSFSFCLWCTRTNPRSAFFLLPSRAWELLIGSYFAVSPLRVLNQRLSEAAGAAGLLLILGSFFVYDQRTWFPGAAAFAPCFGAALLIFSGTGARTAVCRLLSVRPVIYVGKTSYSLYLWHWPIIVFVSYCLDRAPGPSERFPIAVAAMVAAALSYRYIEQPFRAGRDGLSRRFVLGFALSATALAVVTGSALYLANGAPWRSDPEVARLDSYRTGQDRTLDHCQTSAPYFQSVCILGAIHRAPTAFLWGDSHAQVIGPQLSGVAAERGRSFEAGIAINCPPLAGVWRADPNAPRYCGVTAKSGFSNSVLRYLGDHDEISTVILAGRWGMWAEGSGYGSEEGQYEELADSTGAGDTPDGRWAIFHHGLEATVQALSRMRKHIVLVADAPEIGRGVAAALAKQQMYRRPGQITVSTNEYLSRQRRVLADFRSLSARYDVRLVYLYQALCGGGTCQVINNGEPLYSDSNHLTVAGANLVRPLLEDAFTTGAK